MYFQIKCQNPRRIFEIWDSVDSFSLYNNVNNSSTSSCLYCQYCYCSKGFPYCLELGSLWNQTLAKAFVMQRNYLSVNSLHYHQKAPLHWK